MTAAQTEPGLERIWQAGRPVDVRATLGGLRRGAGDPAHRVSASGEYWWAAATPGGDATLALRSSGGASATVSARAWGPGASWLLDRVPTLLGERDDWSQLDLTGHDRLRDVLRRRPGLRLPRTELVMDALVPAVLEQRVTGHESRRSWRDLLRRFGTPAPGPAADMWVPPSAAALLDIPTWEWHRLGVDLPRQRAIRAAATVANRIEECVELDLDAGLARLRHVPGIGQWTAAETAQRSLGHPDAISVGDFHLKDLVTHYFTGRARGTDEQMVELLDPWAGQRQRMVLLIELSGVGKPRFGPRFAPTDTRRI